MKKFLLSLAILAASSLMTTSEAQNVNVNINIGSQPAWGPVGYNYVNYYYIPEINVYYNVPQSMFYYMHRGHWISSRYLPYSYQRYDIYPMYKVVLNDRDPWLRNRHHVRDYGRYKGARNQVIIYNSNDSRYHNSRKNTAPWYNQNNSYNNRYNNNRNEHYNNPSAANKNSRPTNTKGRSNNKDNRVNAPMSQRNNLSDRTNTRNNNSNNFNSEPKYTQASRHSSKPDNTRQIEKESKSRSNQSERHSTSKNTSRR